MERYTNVFKALADVTRLRLVRALQAAGVELCICELMDALDLPQYAVSRHMKELRTAGIVRERREGRYVYFSLAGGDDAFVEKVLDATAEAADAVIRADGERLARRLALRECGRCVVTKGEKGKRK